MNGKIFAVLMCLALAPVAGATDALYQNWDNLYYTLPSADNEPEQIDAFAFDNEAVYSVTYNTWINNQVRFSEPWWNTRFFTNNQVMIINAPFPTNGNFSFQSSGAGFRFDTQAGNSNVMAGTFYNPGSIRCDSYRDGNNIFIFGGFSFIFQTSIGVCEVSATNIINPGEMVASPNGRIQLTGTNVDLNRATLTMEGAAANVAGTGDFGLNTNYWDPGSELGSTFAISAPFRIAPGQLSLGNSTAYFHFTSPNPTNTIIRSVFIEDNSDSNVTYNVYFDTGGVGFGNGNVTIEWVGSYLDSFSGNIFTNYLYLNDDYVRGASTNVALNANGIPDNFTFTASDTRLINQPPDPAGFYPVFPSGSITNGYAFVNAQLISSTVVTNATVRNPSGALTNLPGRIHIAAGRDLDLTLASITGPNYMSIQSPYQFEGSAGAQIISPYSDINVGVTNGFLTVSNLMQPVIPNWSGTVQAWSTRWLVTITTTNTVGTNVNVVVTGTNDYRVLIVGSKLAPTTLAYVQDLILHGTNSLVLSDGFSVLRKLSVDARNLTLTTNEPGKGATALDGELNLFSTIVWSSALPNLRNLTNYGAIRVANGSRITFGSAASPGGAFINHTLVSDFGALIYVTNFESDGVFSNASLGSFTLQSQTATFTNGVLCAGANITIATSNLLMSNVVLRAGSTLTLQATNRLTDGFYLTNGFNPNTTNLNFWSVGLSNVATFNGLTLPVKPQTGDLLGTTISNYVYGPNKAVTITWAGTNYGVSTSGYSNNAAVGHLILDSQAASSIFRFSGVSTTRTNALYVDWLDLRNQATNRDLILGNSNFVAVGFSTNLVIYYARATVGGLDIADKMNGKNTNHLRWVPQYTGYFSATNMVYPDGTTNAINASVAHSTSLDSDGDGIANAYDTTPFFTPSQLIQTITMTNIGGINYPRISWTSPPGATNFVLYSVNPAGPFTNILTTVISPSLVPPAGGWPVTNSVVDLSGISRYYMEKLDLNTMISYGL